MGGEGRWPPFACSMASEYALLESRLGFREADFARILVDARAASFASRRL